MNAQPRSRAVASRPRRGGDSTRRRVSAGPFAERRLLPGEETTTMNTSRNLMKEAMLA
jgi:hypothetical protein